ncbi:sorting nexin-13-like [Tubulanus polymorphus]|uniref:sorting nexin-13-like n=1 Tax=Tubulanus polymorphus TaxID=672921 RepID=UPI003DA235CD
MPLVGVGGVEQERQQLTTTAAAAGSVLNCCCAADKLSKKHSSSMSSAGLDVGLVCWFTLGLGLCGATFGLTGITFIIVMSVTFIVGMLTSIYHYSSERCDQVDQSPRRHPPKPQPGFKKLIDEVTAKKPIYKTDKRLTGANMIDEVLQDVLQYAFRDFINSWYRRISENEIFLNEVRQTTQQIVVAFAERSKQVDWVSFTTRKAVDDVASHLKLYRKSCEKINELKKDGLKPLPDLEAIFFDLETDMEDNMCRDHICLNRDKEQQYLADLSELLLFLLLPRDDFNNKPFRYILKEVLVTKVFLPTIDMLSDPDYVNQTISWLCKDFAISTEMFMTVIKMTDCVDELTAVKEKVDADIVRQRSKDTGGDDDILIKAQLSSLHHVKEVCEYKIQRLRDGNEDTLESLDFTKLIVPGQKLYSLPFDAVLRNNVALDCYMEFLTTIGAQGYLFFCFHCDGFRSMVEQQMSDVHQKRLNNVHTEIDVESIRNMAFSIYEQYLSDKSSQRINVDDALIKRTYERIKNGNSYVDVFDEVQARVYDKLQEDHLFVAFKKSQKYIELLAELDLLEETSNSDNEIEDFPSIPSSVNSVEDLNSSKESISSNELQKNNMNNTMMSSTSAAALTFTLKAKITQSGIAHDESSQRKEYALYAVNVMRINYDGTEEEWPVYRRYSDFHDLHMTIKNQFEDLAGLHFPGKKAFNNMSKEFVEKRRKDLDLYLQSLLQPNTLLQHKGLTDVLLNFFEPGQWEKCRGNLVQRMNSSIMNPFKNSVRSVSNAVKSVPENLVDGVVKVGGGISRLPGNVVDGFGKLFTSGKTMNSTIPNEMKDSASDVICDSSKVGASLDEDDDDNIPLRIMLLMMDEVFDLRNKNQWLRRRIVAILRQIIKATFGDRINRKIVDQVEWLTSAEQMAEYVKSFRDNMWPCGILTDVKPTRDLNTCMRTRVACKTRMLATLSDEIKTLMGTDTTRLGVHRVFNMFQHECLNRRLVYVFLEGFLETLFPDNKFRDVFRKIHSQSGRVKPDAGIS